MFTLDEIVEILSLLEKEKKWILDTTAYYSEKPEVLEKILQSTYKERLKVIDSAINKLKSMEVKQ